MTYVGTKLKSGLTTDAATHMIELASAARANGDWKLARQIDEDGRRIDRVARENDLLFDLLRADLGSNSKVL